MAAPLALDAGALSALRTVPGLSIVQTGSYGGTTSLFIRDLHA